MRACPQCGEQVGESAKFCPECGAALAEPRAAREERKVVTVVFCDLVGSTAQAERLDPEDVRAILSGYHEQVRTELERFGGTVEKFIGDAVMAVFGAPVAHEDDPERAVRAAFAVRDAAINDAGLQVRVAVHTGEALVALDARSSEGEAMVAGDVVNTAARLQSAAPPNGVLVGETTYRATERAIEYREHARVEAKGKAEPVAAWEAVQARSRFGVDLARTSSAPLVGRERELELLVASLARVTDERAPQLVTLVGVPGIGKSRLLAELFAAVDRSDQFVTWRQGRSLPYGDGVSYWALGEMVKAQAGVLETDAPDEAATKLAAAVERLLPDGNEAAWVHAHVLPLAGLAADEGTRDRRGEAFAAWRRFFEALAEQRPLVLVFEDLHWADDGLLDFVDHLVDWLTDVPVLVVASARPELLTRRPSWGGGKPNATTVSLAPLSSDETARLVHGLLEQSVLPAELQTALLERAGGNPLYAEEFVRMVTERGRADLELPESVQGIIAARLDGLEREDKELLQAASVVGKVFWCGALAEIGGRERFDVEERLHGLERRELVRRARRASVAGESEYAFQHALVRDVAYAAIPRAARAEWHRRAAEWIEGLGRPEDHADLLAHHYVSALELARAAGVDAGVLPASAARALRWAGDRAFALNAFVSAAKLYEEALAFVEGDTDEGRATLFQLGRSLHRAGDERRVEVLEAARDAHLAAGDRATAAEACALIAFAWWHRGSSEQTTEHLEQAQELVRGSPPSRAGAFVLAEAARLAMLRGDRGEALRTASEALELAEQLELDDVAISVLITIGTVRADEGEIAQLEEATERALAANHVDAARGYNNLASVLYERGELDRSREYWLVGREVAERLGNGTVRRFIESQLMWIDYDDGRWDEALRSVDAFIDECRTAPHYNEGGAHALRALVLLARDDGQGAEAALERGLELSRAIGDPQALRPVLGVSLRINLELGRRDAAAATARELLESVTANPREQGLLPLAKAADALGIGEQVRAAAQGFPPTRTGAIVLAILDGELERAAVAFGEMGDHANEAEFRLRAAESYAAAGRLADADRNLQRALAFYRAAGAPRYVRRAEALLAKTA